MVRFLALTALLSITGCGMSSEIDACGKGCRLGMKSFTTVANQPTCTCNQLEDVYLKSLRCEEVRIDNEKENENGEVQR